MQFISIEQIQAPTNSSSLKNLRVVRLDLSALVTFFKKPKTFKYLSALAYFRPTVTPLQAEPLKVYNGFVTPVDNNVRTVNNYTPYHIAGANGGITTWNPSEDIMFFNDAEAWRGEVEAMNDFWVSLVVSNAGVTASADDVIIKILLGYDV